MVLCALLSRGVEGGYGTLSSQDNDKHRSSLSTKAGLKNTGENGVTYTLLGMCIKMLHCGIGV
jgi:hypothetical protein